MSKTFYTIFPRAENFHLIKDVGMVPFILQKYYGADSTITTFKNNKDYPYITNELNGLKIDFIEQIFKSNSLNLICYILRNFKKIDILQFYHFEVNQLDIIGFYIILRKIFFKKSFTYIKCDGSGRFVDTNLDIIRFKFFRKWVIKNIDLYTIETDKDFHIIKSLSNYKNINLKIMANGFYNFKKDDDNDDEKEKVFLFVGRVGSAQKNVELLVEAFIKFNKVNPAWKLLIVGKIEGNFNLYINSVFEENHEISNFIQIIGEVNSREELEKYYKKSAVFVLPSRYESFGISCVEALSWGCSLILSDEVPLQKEFENAKGVTFFKNEDENELLNAMLLYSKNDSDKNEIDYRINFAYEHFYWPKVLKVVDDAYNISSQK